MHAGDIDVADSASPLDKKTMSTVAAPDRSILQIFPVEAPASIEDVIQRMQALDNALTVDDGLKWFNLLYLTVTQQVKNSPPQDGWHDPLWIEHLDVVFAGLYFKAVVDFVQGSPVASSWQALFEARRSQGIDRIQFALAGMNAHINHDLSLALVDVDAEMHKGLGRGTPEHDDYEHVNGLLEAVLPQALKLLATGLLGEVAQDTGKIGRLLAIWNVRVARDLAWDFAAHLQTLSGPAREFALVSQDKLTGAIGRSLLIPIP